MEFARLRVSIGIGVWLVSSKGSSGETPLLNGLVRELFKTAWLGFGIPMRRWISYLVQE